MFHVTDDATKTDPRVVRSRTAILTAATETFLREGYTATTMDAIAAEAGVSKRTVYNNFRDKEALFREVTLAATAIAAPFAGEIAAKLAEPPDLEAALLSLARRLITRAADPSVVRLRRLLIGEAHRFPDIAAEYYRLAPGKVIATLTRAFASLASRDLLKVTDPGRAAEHFAFLVLGADLDRAMFDGNDSEPSAESRTRAAEEGVRTFLAAYAPVRRPTSSPPLSFE